MLWNAFVSGLLLSGVMTALLLAVLRINPEMMLNDYPPDIRARFGPMSAKGRRQRAVWSAIMLIALVAVVAWSFRRLDALVGDVTFSAAFVHTVVMFMLFNVVDLVLIDAVLVWRQPAWVILPGTEGMAGYRDYWFHVRGFGIGTAGIVLLGGVLGALTAWLM